MLPVALALDYMFLQGGMALSFMLLSLVILFQVSP